MDNIYFSLVSSKELTNNVYNFSNKLNALMRETPTEPPALLEFLKKQTEEFQALKLGENPVVNSNIKNYEKALSETIDQIDQRIKTCARDALSLHNEKSELEKIRGGMVEQLAELKLGSSKTLQIEQMLEEHFKPEDPGCSLIIMQEGKILWEKTVGMAEPGKEVRSPDMPQHFGSVSKQFTAMCVALLVEEGKIDLEEDIRHCIPSMQTLPPFKSPEGKEVTIKVKDLLHMQSGLPDTIAIVEFNGYNDQDLMEKDKIELLKNFFQKQPFLSFEPGKAYGYSNTNYVLLAELVAARSPEGSLRDFAQKEIFSKLGMLQTSFMNPDPISKVDMLKGYTLEGGKWIESTTRNRTSGACGVVGTARDMAKWDAVFAKPSLGKNPSKVMEIMRGPSEPPKNVEVTFQGPNLKDSQYLGGLCVGRTIDDDYAIEAHPGGIEGFGAMMMRLRPLNGQERPLTVFMAFNRDHGDDNPTQILPAILELCIGKKILQKAETREEAAFPQNPPQVDLDRYVAQYSNPISGRTCELISFKEEDGSFSLGLNTKKEGKSFLRFAPTDKPGLFEVGVGTTIQFTENNLSFVLNDDRGGFKNLVFQRI